ncbi:hypothetical protein Scel_33540 [Streptomyces cellostaticus]|nr:hypothetical protein Scel_33540 [Streptomyces cellostaticus]
MLLVVTRGHDQETGEAVLSVTPFTTRPVTHLRGPAERHDRVRTTPDDDAPDARLRVVPSICGSAARARPATPDPHPRTNPHPIPLGATNTLACKNTSVTT